jgi:hypothetical protein
MKPGSNTIPMMILSLLGFCHPSFGQQKSIGIDFIGRYDRHANYTTNFGGRASNDDYILWGHSFGVTAFYRKQIKKKLFFGFSSGYYRLGVDKMEEKTGWRRTSRYVDYRERCCKVLYSTSNYHYNNFSFGLAVGKNFVLNAKTQLDIEGDFITYSTFSQSYKLDTSNRTTPYITHNHKRAEHGVNFIIGIVKVIDRYYYRPGLVVPIYQKLKGDREFFEDPDMNIEKWFDGIGLSVSVGRYL